MKYSKGVVICGVGGQGAVLLSKVFGDGLMASGYDVKKTEQHGLSQRGGSVNAQIKFGEKVYAPVVSEGTASMIVALEKVEALKWLKCLAPGGTLVVNDYELLPVGVKLGKEEYPKDLTEKYKAAIPDTVTVNAAEIAERCGTAKAQSMVILGIMAKKLELLDVDWEAAIKENVPAKFVEANLNAFREGLKL